jgi:peroxiredoxin (alkyl hydroperoxide reductase subunit C)
LVFYRAGGIAVQLQVGKQAPEFEVDAYIRGKSEPQRVSLSDYRGKWVVLFFYPRDFTFVCPTEIQEFAELHAEFTKEKAVVLGASTDSYFSHKAWFESDERLLGVDYPVLADTAQKIAQAYGILLEDGTALRGTFLIDPNGVLKHLQVNDLDVGRNTRETLRLLKAFRTGELCPSSWQPGEATLSVKIPVEV